MTNDDRTYRWDLDGNRVSFRKGGRIALVSKTRVVGGKFAVEWIAPEDQEEFRRQYEEHLEASTTKVIDLMDALKRAIGGRGR